MARNVQILIENSLVLCLRIFVESDNSLQPLNQVRIEFAIRVCTEILTIVFGVPYQTPIREWYITT